MRQRPNTLADDSDQSRLFGALPPSVHPHSWLAGFARRFCHYDLLDDSDTFNALTFCAPGRRGDQLAIMVQSLAWIGLAAAHALAFALVTIGGVTGIQLLIFAECLIIGPGFVLIAAMAMHDFAVERIGRLAWDDIAATGISLADVQAYALFPALPVQHLANLVTAILGITLALVSTQLALPQHIEYSLGLFAAVTYRFVFVQYCLTPAGLMALKGVVSKSSRIFWLSLFGMLIALEIMNICILFLSAFSFLACAHMILHDRREIVMVAVIALVPVWLVGVLILSLYRQLCVSTDRTLGWLRTHDVADLASRRESGE